jgi:hypothetical protein
MRPVGFGIYACAGRDALMRMVRDGDPRAIDLLNRALPRDLDKGVCRSIRDDGLRRAASLLRAAIPGSSEHSIGLLLAKAGAEVDAAGTLARVHAFDGFDTEDISALELEIRSSLDWCEKRRDGRRWPKLRQILNII